MNKGGEIVIIEDDVDDQQMLAEVFSSLDIPNKITFFADGKEVVEYLLKPEVAPFLILSHKSSDFERVWIERQGFSKPWNQ